MKSIVIFSSLMCSFLFSFTQQTKETKASIISKENAFIGGNVTLSFGQQGSGIIIGANPMYGYTIKKWLDVASVLNIQYNKFQIDANALLNGRQRNMFLLGTGISTRVYPLNFVFLQVQPEINFISIKEKPIPFLGATGPTITTNKLVPSILVGGGYKQGFNGGRTFSYVSLLFDVAGNSNSPYKDIFGNIVPIFRIGMNFSLADLNNK